MGAYRTSINRHKIKELFSIVKKAMNGTILSEHYLFKVKTDCGCWSEVEHNFSNVINRSVLCAVSRTMQASWLGLFQAWRYHVQSLKPTRGTTIVNYNYIFGLFPPTIVSSVVKNSKRNGFCYNFSQQKYKRLKKRFVNTIKKRWNTDFIFSM